VAGYFTVGALAIAADAANAVGAVRLTCGPRGLEVELVRVGWYVEHFALGEVVESVHFTVPYTAIRALVRRGRMLCLSLDPAAATPYNRFALVRFTPNPAGAPAIAYRTRAAAGLARAVLPAPLGALGAVLAPANLVAGLLGRASLGVIVALAVWLMLREIDHALTWGGPIADQYRDALEHALTKKMGFIAALAPAPIPVPEPPTAIIHPADAGPPAAAMVSPSYAPGSAPGGRLRAVLSIALIAVGAVAAIALFRRFTEPGNAPPPPATLTARMAPAAERLLQADLTPRPPELPRCTCARADSPLWKDPLPILSTLMFPRTEDGQGEITPVPDRRGVPRYDFDLAVVNNSARPIDELSLVVTFARRNPEGERTNVTDRGLYWGSPLDPGRSIKWRVRAPGTELRLDVPPLGSLSDPGAEPAPADAFFKLSAAHYRRVRVHAAMMLAYHRDPRAIDAVHSLGAGSSQEEKIFARILRASAPLMVCGLSRVGEQIEACLFNGFAKPVRVTAMREVHDDPALTGRTWPVDAIVPVHEGAKLSAPLGEGELPAEVEVVQEGQSQPSLP
jgi:hypothetical protein